MDDTKLTLMEHLEELRARLWKVVLAVLVLGGLSLWYSRQIFGFLMQPVLAALPEESRALVYTSGIEEINVLLKVGLYAGIFLSTPVALLQIWRFVAPGLLPQERKYVGPFVGFGTAFFIGGAMFCYFAVLPTMFDFLLRPGESAPIRDRVTLARSRAEDAARLLVLGDDGKAVQAAKAVDELLGKSGDGAISSPGALTNDKAELTERLALMGHVLDLETGAATAPEKKTALAEAVLRRGEAQTLLEQGSVTLASGKLEDAAANLVKAHPGAGETVTAVWGSLRHLAAGRGQLTEQEWTRPMLSMKEQLSLVLLLEVAFGAIFELPLIMALLAVLGILKFKWIWKYQRHAILVCVAAAAIITPSGDAVNLALMALPMIFCFELGVLFVWIFERRRADQKTAVEAGGPPVAPAQ